MAVVPKPLQESLRNRRCMLFVGSGPSISAGYPTWRQLVEALVQEASATSPVQATSLQSFAAQNQDLLLVAEYARDILGRHRYANVLRTLLAIPKTTLPIHQSMARANYRAIITTNYDKLIEAAVFFERNWPPPVYVYHSLSSLGSALSAEQFFVFKLHGDVDDPGHIVLTSQDYDRVILSSPFVRSFLQAIFLNFTLLFVGYGHADPDFQLVLKEMNLIFDGHTPTHYALMPDPHDFIAESFNRSMNVQVIPYDSHNDHAEAADFLSEIARLFPYP